MDMNSIVKVKSLNDYKLFSVEKINITKISAACLFLKKQNLSLNTCLRILEFVAQQKALR